MAKKLTVETNFNFILRKSTITSYDKQFSADVNEVDIPDGGDWRLLNKGFNSSNTSTDDRLLTIIDDNDDGTDTKYSLFWDSDYEINGLEKLLYTQQVFQNVPEYKGKYLFTCACTKLER